MKISNKIILKLRNELLIKQKPLHTIKEIKTWYKKIIKKSKVKIKIIPLDQCKNWKLNKKGQISHTSGSFYKVEGVRILKSFNREVKGGWDQPMFTEPGFDGGILGLLKKKIEIHYLGYYLKWVPQEAFYYAVKNCGFSPRPYRTQGTYSKYNSIDDKIDDLHYYTTFIKFGLGRATYDASQEIRNKHLTLDEGKLLVKKLIMTLPINLQSL